MLAVKLVANRETKAPIDRAVPMKVQKRAYKAGAMVRVSGNTVIILPPLVMTVENADMILNALKAGLAAI